MKFSIRGLGLAVASLALTVVVGCAENNEKELLKETGSKGTVAPNAPTDQKAYMEQQKAAGGTANIKTYTQGAAGYGPSGAMPKR